MSSAMISNMLGAEVVVGSSMDGNASFLEQEKSRHVLMIRRIPIEFSVLSSISWEVL